MNMPARRLIPAAAVLFVVATMLLAVRPAAAENRWGEYHWARTANPFTLTLVNRLTTTEWKAHLATSAADWGESSVMDLATIVSGKGCKAVSGRIVACNGRFGFSGWLGLAQIWASGNHIVQGLAKMNDTYFNTRTYNSSTARLHVLCQEVGHAFGLNHQRDPASNTCMDDVNGLFDPAFTAPNAHDYEELELIYAHLDTGTTIQSFGASLFAVGPRPSAATTSGEDGDDWGVPVAHGPDGRANVFLQDEGGEHKVTFVYWAPRGNPEH